MTVGAQTSAAGNTVSGDGTSLECTGRQLRIDRHSGAGILLLQVAVVAGVELGYRATRCV